MLKRKLKKQIKNFAIYICPVGLYKFVYRNRHRDYFKEEYIEYVKNNNNEHLLYVSDKTYKAIVSVQGIGFSGSGAVLDLLCEIDSCDVVGSIENGKNKEDHNGMFESDFLRLSGGLFEFESFLNSKNVFQKDALVKRFISFLNMFPLFKHDLQIRRIFYIFLNNISELTINGIKGTPYNRHLYSNKDYSSIFLLRPLSLNKYRHLCSQLLTNLFNYINKSKSDILVFDQLFQDLEYDIDKYKEYIPEAKVIVVYRDPRDVYTFAKSRNVEWIAHESAEQFVKWYQIMTRGMELHSNNYLVVQFEKLICDYEFEINRILVFLGIDKSNHSNKRIIFNPDISRNNIGIWKKSKHLSGDFKIIERDLPIFCFND